MYRAVDDQTQLRLREAVLSRNVCESELSVERLLLQPTISRVGCCQSWESMMDELELERSEQTGGRATSRIAVRLDLGGGSCLPFLAGASTMSL